VDIGDSVALEEPTYNNVLGAATALGLRTAPVAMAEDGVDLAALERTLARPEVKAFYTIPTFHNPMGTTTSLPHRRRLLEYYRAELLAQGVAAPSLDDLYRYYQWHAAYVWVGAAATLAMGDAWQPINYVMASLEDVMTVSYPGPCMHEALFDDRFLKGTGVETLDFAKAMIDEGFHPMTMYFPLVVHGAMLIEPTETESKAGLDQFIAALRDLAEAAKNGDTARFKEAPRFSPLRRLDETQAARNPVLRWTKPE